MSRDKHVKIIIRTDGSCSIDAVDFTDASCTTVIQYIASALAGPVTQEQLKPEARIPMRCAGAEREAAR